MRVILPFHAGDAHLAKEWVDWALDLTTEKHGDLTLVCDNQVDAKVIAEIHTVAARVFNSTRILSVSNRRRWPDGPNHMFKEAAKAHANEPFLWMEPDAIPLKPGWLELIEDAYVSCGKPFMGHRYECHNPRFPQFLMSGICVYPANAREMVPVLENTPLAWDVESAETMVSHGAHTSLITHFWGEPNLPPTFVALDAQARPRNSFTVDQIPSDAVIWHRNKDGSLVRLLRRRMGIAVNESEPEFADIVSLRRAGDIVCLLPALRRESERLKRPVRLVVHTEFLPILSGVSYVEGVEWKGDWEAPLDAARKFGARNAQVFGRGLQPDTVHGNFAKIAWANIGHNWDRHAPLVFDQRNPERETLLCQSVFKTQKPKILVKLHGFSSPFMHGDLVMTALNARFGAQAEIVNLDNVKAEQLYDLIGLIDQAACLVSIDTVTLWLASASKCPVVAFTNGTGFGASPPRGNVVSRTPYHEVPARIEAILPIIGYTLRQSATDGIALAFQDHRPGSAEAQSRQDAAYASWPKLNAELVAYSPGRTSKEIGDSRAMPYIRDIVKKALTTKAPIIAIINNDIVLLDGVAEAVRESCAKYGCFWSYRLDDNGKTDEGADFFAFTRAWWDTHQHYFPDFLIGYWGWDDVFVRMMRWSGCLEQKRVTYHKPHPATQSPTRLNAVGHHHNEHLFQRWLMTHHESREKPKNK